MGSEMCIRDSRKVATQPATRYLTPPGEPETNGSRPFQYLSAQPRFYSAQPRKDCTDDQRKEANFWVLGRTCCHFEYSRDWWNLDEQSEYPFALRSEQAEMFGRYWLPRWHFTMLNKRI